MSQLTDKERSARTTPLERRAAEMAAAAATKAATLPACSRCGERKVVLPPDAPGPKGVVDLRHLCEQCYYGCQDCGRRRDSESGRGLCSRCRMLRRLHAVIPPTARDVTMDQVRDVQPPAVVEVLDRFLKERYSGLILSGTVGTGKTCAAAAVSSEMVMSGEANSFMFSTAAEMLHALRPGREGIERYADCDLLVLDDVGRERLETDWAQETFFMVVDQRWRTRRQTIVTTNLAPQFLPARIGDAAWDRLRDGALGVKFAGKSMRQMAS